jgi:hypothetical protein
MVNLEETYFALKNEFQLYNLDFCTKIRLGKRETPSREERQDE